MSKLFEWSQDLELGVTAMDDQHKVLIDKINKLIEGLTEEKGNTLQEFSELAKYVIFHFDEEEKYMEGIGYPGLDLHKTIHKQLLEKVSVFQEELEAGKLDNDKLINFLKMWLRSHIMGIDMKYGTFSKEKAA